MGQENGFMPAYQVINTNTVHCMLNGIMLGDINAGYKPLGIPAQDTQTWGKRSFSR